MSITEFQIYRMNIVSALKKAGIKENNIFFYKDTIPVSFPSAFVVLELETGILKTSKRYLDSKFSFVIYLIISSEKAKDPDSEILILKEAFRVEYQLLLKKDFVKVEYYNARADAGRKVKIACITTETE